MTLLWKDPPPRANAVFNEGVIAALRDRPGEWALIRTYSRHARVKSDFGYRPFEVEIRLRYHKVHRPEGHTELYARWVPGGQFE